MLDYRPLSGEQAFWMQTAAGYRQNPESGGSRLPTNMVGRPFGRSDVMGLGGLATTAGGIQRQRGCRRDFPLWCATRRGSLIALWNCPIVDDQGDDIQESIPRT